MIKTIDTVKVPRHILAKLCSEDHETRITAERELWAWLQNDNSNEAAPEVKAEPIGVLTLGGIEGNEYGENDIDLSLKAIEALQEKLVTSENPVALKVYANRPAVSDMVERIKALQLPEHDKDINREYRTGRNDAIRWVLEIIKGAK